MTSWTIAQQTSLSMDFSRQKYLPFPSPGNSPNPGFEPGLLHCRQILYIWARGHVASGLGLSLADSCSVFKLGWMEGHLDSENQERSWIFLPRSIWKAIWLLTCKEFTTTSLTLEANQRYFWVTGDQQTFENYAVLIHISQIYLLESSVRIVVLKDGIQIEGSYKASKGNRDKWYRLEYREVILNAFGYHEKSDKKRKKNQNIWLYPCALI